MDLTPTAATINVPTTVDTAAGGTLLTVKATSGSPVLQLQSADTGSSSIWFGDAGDLDQGRIFYTDNSKYMALFADNTEFMRGSATAATINVPLTLASGGTLSAGKQISIPDWGGAAPSTAVGIGGQKTNLSASSSGNTNLISNGWYDGSVYRSGTANQFTALNYTAGATTSLTETAWSLFSTQDATMAANSDLSTKLVTLVKVTHAGAVTLGPSAGGVTHGYYGGIRTLTSFSTLSNGMSVGNLPGVSLGATTLNVDYFTGGVEGQILIYAGGNASSAPTFRHNTGATGQKFLLPGGADITLTGFGGALFVYLGGFWIMVSHTN
jgi:hypothetical protein